MWLIIVEYTFLLTQMKNILKEETPKIEYIIIVDIIYKSELFPFSLVPSLIIKIVA